MSVKAELLEKPLPKPEKSLAGYAYARALEALLKAILALEFLDRGYTRNAAGKAFQAWKALVGALLVLEKDNLDRVLGREEEEKKWLLETGIPHVPTTKLKRLAQLLERVGHEGVSQATSMALDLHDYQYYGPDPDMAMSKYTCREEAATDIPLLVKTVVRLVEEKIRPRLEEKQAWSKEHSQALQQLKQKLEYREQQG